MCIRDSLTPLGAPPCADSGGPGAGEGFACAPACAAAPDRTALHDAAAGRARPRYVGRSELACARHARRHWCSSRHQGVGGGGQLHAQGGAWPRGAVTTKRGHKIRHERCR
eukprot:1096219-Pyramimonas_sp.AAC.1